MKFSCFPLIMGCGSSKTGSYTFPLVQNGHHTPSKSSSLNQESKNGSIHSSSDDDSYEQNERIRRPGIPAPGGTEDNETSPEIETLKFDKDQSSRELIKKALLSNEFLNYLLDDEKTNLVIDAMYPKEVEANSFIIKEGETGSHLFVSAEGSFEVIKGENTVVNKIGIGESFGELALLYGAKRLASIKVLSPAKLWVLDRSAFQKIIKFTVLQQHEVNIKFLSSYPLFKELHPTVLAKLSDLLKREFFKSGEVIIRQGDKGDKFYIIRAGTVKISKKLDGEDTEQSFYSLSQGDYFGELALQSEENIRQATVTALNSGVECLTLDREAFHKYIGDLDELKNTDKYINVPPVKRVTSEYAYINLEDLTLIGTLGVGGFGRVDLVQYKNDTHLTFALKKMKKIDIVQQQQQEHAWNEKNIMINCKSPFICRLYNTYRDSKYLYYLMEPCLGGDVWTILRKKREFDESTARFMSACVIEAFEYLHKRNFIYRDLKPENLMLNEKGYVKLVDFGFAKKVSDGVKTWTFAVTPEYAAPEIILNRGHNRAVDYWTLGILIHELLVGKPPFRGSDHMKTYSLILKGIDKVTFSSKIPHIVQNLIKKLCRQVSTERLGCFRDGIKDIKNHRWYLGFNWDALQNGTWPAPLINPVKNNRDMSNFDPQPQDDDDPPEEDSGWDEKFDYF